MDATNEGNSFRFGVNFKEAWWGGSIPRIGGRRLEQHCQRKKTRKHKKNAQHGDWKSFSEGPKKGTNTSI